MAVADQRADFIDIRSFQLRDKSRRSGRFGLHPLCGSLPAFISAGTTQRAVMLLQRNFSCEGDFQL